MIKFQHDTHSHNGQKWEKESSAGYIASRFIKKNGKQEGIFALRFAIEQKNLLLDRVLWVWERKNVVPFN